MSKRRAPTLADSAAAAAHGRRVVCSTGSLDGALFQALAAVRIVPDAGSDMPSTWGPGVHQVGENGSDKLGLSEGGTDGTNSIT